MINFKSIDEKLATELLDFAQYSNIGQITEIDGASYKLDHISRSSSSFFKSRGLSIYYRHKKSVIRISDHWSASVGNDRSRKLNCGLIDGHKWIVSKSEKVETHKFGGGKYAFQMLAGIAGLSTLNKTCEHWK